MIRIVALCVAVMAVFAFFDFSLRHDVAHYLTNIAPALHLLHGGTLLVDTFSQYGPGPVLMTLLGFQFGPTTFGAAQITVQLSNFVFCGIWLVCLFRMTRWKLAALLLGIVSIAFFFGAHVRGYQNINEAPSHLGLRYLPALLMVLALSYLNLPKRHSVFTALSTFIAGIWSVEALVGTLAVHLACLGLLAFRERAIKRLVVDGIVAIIPAIAAIVLMTLVVVLRAGVWPDYVTYLQYLSSYNPTAPYWAVVADPMYFGWLAMLLAVFVVWADAWTRVFSQSARVTNMSDGALYYRFVPMAMLTMVHAAYFVGRAHPTSLILAVLPFCAIAIPAILAFSSAVLAKKGPARLLVLAPVAAGVWMLSFTLLSLVRQQSPYSLVLHECRDLARCSPSALAEGLNEAIHRRPVLEKMTRLPTDGYFDTAGTVRDAVSMMNRWARDEPEVTVMLGMLCPEGCITVMTEVALMYAGKWNRWPRSFTPTDELVLPLAQRIIDAPVRLREGELVLVRRNEALLGMIEAGILKRIRAEATLCRLPDSSKEVVAYRVAGSAGCAPM